ncbi:hypothetical protein E2C01_035397 [Portunus trituberculatus]|uniref:Uncharacterized protein n=1 Tax=Portunus trituberculatus TaxID=210409 RepID=A0A5B7F5L5_PORTR|nr:hypothetical protein [Portunus trituberculatus]
MRDAGWPAWGCPDLVAVVVVVVVVVVVWGRDRSEARDQAGLKMAAIAAVNAIKSQIEALLDQIPDQSTRLSSLLSLPLSLLIHHSPL